MDTVITMQFGMLQYIRALGECSEKTFLKFGKIEILFSYSKVFELPDRPFLIGEVAAEDLIIGGYARLYEYKNLLSCSVEQ